MYKERRIFINESTRKKPFDSANSFTFYGSWVEAIEYFEENGDIESAYGLFKAVANYSMYGMHPEFNSPALKAIWHIIAREIESSVDRRKRGFSTPAPNNNQQRIIDLYKKNPHLSCREIAEVTGTGKSTVQRTIKKFCNVDIATDSASDSTPDIDSNNDTDSIGTGQRDTMEYLEDLDLGEQLLSDDDLPF